MSGTTMQQNEDGTWVEATPLPRQGTQIDWEVSRKNGRWYAKAYDAREVCVHTLRSRSPRLLALKIRWAAR